MEANQERATGAHHPQPCRHVDVILISMPFGPLVQPSLGLGLLKGGLVPLGISTRILFFTLRFAQLVGPALYRQIANGEPASYDLVGEWLFAESLFGSDSLDAEGYIEDVLRGRSPAHRGLHSGKKPAPESFIENLLAMRTKVEGFLSSCLEEVLSYRPKIVGFTSVFQQHVAALSLARRLKAQAAETCIVFGGANCEGVMGAELVRQFPFVDAVVSGEGDIVFPELVQRVLQGASSSDLQGVYTRQNSRCLAPNGRYPNAPIVRKMDVLPFPDFDDFFEQWEALQLAVAQPPRLTFETSRGCWWGEKSHCTFCGLNGATMTYRSKSARRALDELLFLTERYPHCPVSVVDNILNMQYFKDFLPELSQQQVELELFYEVKANLKKEQVHLLHDAGITMIQPGIESLSNRVLEVMKKGVKGLQNIQLLKWCKELGVAPAWNVLWGFPGEPPEEYAHMAEMIPFLSHLPPPLAAATIRLDRFSPHFDEAERFGFRQVAPYPAYFLIYPFDPDSVARLAYFFTFEYAQAQDVASYTQPVAEKIAEWQKIHSTSDLFSVDKGTHLLIWDLRPVAQHPLSVLTGVKRILYLSCDGIRTVRQLQQVIEEQALESISGQQIEEVLHPLVKKGLMLREGNSYLSLAIPLGTYSPARAILERFYETIRQIGKLSEHEIVIPLDDLVEKGEC